MRPDLLAPMVREMHRSLAVAGIRVRLSGGVEASSGDLDHAGWRGDFAISAGPTAFGIATVATEIEPQPEMRVAFTARIDALGAVLDAERAFAAAAGSETARILIADDDPGIRALVRLVLGRRGYEIVECPDGPSALAQLRTGAPDLALIDWMMPGMNGPEVVEHARAEGSGVHVPVVLLTSNATPDDVLAALRAGAFDIVPKPFETKTLAARVERFARRRALLAPGSSLGVEIAATTVEGDFETIGVGALDDRRSEPRPFAGDVVAAAAHAQQSGRLEHALTLLVGEARKTEAEAGWSRASVLYRYAAASAQGAGEDALADALLRLAGSAALTIVEESNDPHAVGGALLSAARCFAAAGTFALAAEPV